MSAYAVGVRSSRQIQRRCHEDLAFRVRHQRALADFLVESLKLCATAGLVRLGMVALDGTKVAANADDRANRTPAKLEEVAEILQQAAEADQAEDRQHGPGLGEDLPAELAAAARARGKQPRANIKPRARDEAPNPRAVANATDPDSRFLRTRNGTVQGSAPRAGRLQGGVEAAVRHPQPAQALAPQPQPIGTDAN